jgi:hypothetical protein
MVRVLVPVFPADIHAKSVRRALHSKGHEAVFLYGGDYPTRQQASLHLSHEAGLMWKLSAQGHDLSNKKFDVVWYRRPTLPILPEDMHPGDKTIARRECIAFNRGFWGLVAPSAFWVNPIAGRDRALSKPIQLYEALHAGLRIPPTLCSNDPGEIRRFLAKYSGEAIYKGYLPAQWDMGDGIAHLYTSEITPDDLPDDEVLKLSPGIFQKKIDKDYELRVTYMGDYSCTAKLLSQQHPRARLDWRPVGTEIEITLGELPEEVDIACRLLMRNLGIVFGCFDFIVTPKGEHVFLEVNEMGQFLWLEEAYPDLLLLESFCSFLIQGWLDHDWRPSGKVVSFKDFRDDLQDEKEEESLHIEVPNYVMVNDL